MPKQTTATIVILGLLVASSCSPSGPSTVGPSVPTLPPRTPPSPPPNYIDSFVADRTTVGSGETVTLSWSVSGTVSYCSMSTGIPPDTRVLIADRLPTVGSLQLRPTETKWYALVTHLEDGRAVLEANIRILVE
jgi:hypothetical protein